MYRIDYYKWGKISVNGTEYSSDIKIYPDEIIPDWWRKKGHELQGSDIPEIPDKGLEYAIIGCGAYGVLKVSDTAVQLFKKQGIIWKALKTPDAVEEYNRLINSGKKAGGFFHLTC